MIRIADNDQMADNNQIQMVDIDQIQMVDIDQIQIIDNDQIKSTSTVGILQYNPIQLLSTDQSDCSIQPTELVYIVKCPQCKQMAIEFQLLDF